nr:AraC family transcriptional regulator [uncultured Roseateles sp.]
MTRVHAANAAPLTQNKLHSNGNPPALAGRSPAKTALESSWRKAMAEALASRGIALEDLLNQLGINPEEADLRVLSDAYNKVWELAAARSGDVGIGLCELKHPLVAMGNLTHLILSARSLGDALAHLQRYSVLLSPTINLELQHGPTFSRLSVEFLKGLHKPPMQRYDFMAHVLLQALAWVTGTRIRPACVEYPFLAPRDTTPWQAAFDCDLQFSAEVFCLVFHSEDLLTPIPTANPAVAALCIAEAQQQMASHEGSVQRRVRQALVQQLPKGDPKRDTIAAMLCMSERTLQRRLLEESTSFNKLLDETRREQAERFLAKGSISATEMSFALGFADPSNFYRACKRWFGHSPSHLRCGV